MEQNINNQMTESHMQCISEICWDLRTSNIIDNLFPVCQSLEGLISLNKSLEGLISLNEGCLLLQLTRVCSRRSLFSVS